MDTSNFDVRSSSIDLQVKYRENLAASNSKKIAEYQKAQRLASARASLSRRLNYRPISAVTRPDIHRNLNPGAQTPSRQGITLKNQNSDLACIDENTDISTVQQDSRHHQSQKLQK